MNNRSRLLAAAALVALIQGVPGLAFAQSQTQAEIEAAEEAQEEATELGEIVVTGSFVATGAESAMKMDVPVSDTPFSVAAYSEAFITSIDTTNVSELYNYMTGVKKAGNTAYDITLRGFKSGGEDRNAVMVDGLPGLAGRFGSPPTVGVERVEVVKGPMSVLYGQIQPGGFLNLISKKPEFNFSGSLEARGSTFAGGDGPGFGDANGLTLSGDVTGPVGSSDAFAYRLVGEWGDRDGFRYQINEKVQYLAPSLTWRIGDDTKLTGVFEYRHSENIFDVGLVAPNRDLGLVADFTTRYSEPNDQREETGYSASLFFTHEFNDAIALNVSGRSVSYDANQKVFTSVSVLQRAGNPNYVVNRRAFGIEFERQYNYIDANLFMKFNTGPIEHKMLVGVNAGANETRENRLKFVNANCTGPVASQLCFDIDVYNPVYGQVPAFDSLPAFNPNLANQSQLLTDLLLKSETTGVYISDLLAFGDHWKLSLGARAFKDSTDLIEQRVVGVAPQRKEASDSFLPSVGLLYQPTDRLTFYGSYAQSYVPASPNFKDANGNNPFDPVEGTQYEVGIKAEKMLEGRLGATLAVFRIDQKNAINSFICPVGTPRAGDLCQSAVGEVRSEGVEFETDFSVTDNWQLLFGYAFIDARVTAALDPVELDQPVANTARHSANLWTRYDWENGFGVGLGVIYTGDRPAILPTGTGLSAVSFDLPAYTVVDLGLYYETGPYSFSLKAGNLLDERYYESTGQTAQIQIAPGAPRSLTFSMRAAF